MISERVFHDRQRTRTVRYRTEDALQNLRIKVIVQAVEGEDAPWVRKERIFSWQEKVFGPEEFKKYKEMSDKGEGESGARRSFSFGHGGKKTSALDAKYTKAMQHVAQGEVLFSYVDVDPFEDEEEYSDSVTSSQEEKPTSLANRTQVTESRRGKFSKDGLGRAVSRPFQVMYLMADLKGRRDPTKKEEDPDKFLYEEVVLCRIRAYRDDGLVDMTPGNAVHAGMQECSQTRCVLLPRMCCDRDTDGGRLLAQGAHQD